MVDVLLLDTLGDFDPAMLLDFSTEFRRDQPGGRSQSFFSDRTIYDATALVQTSRTGVDDGYLGHVAIAPGGGLGFNPDVVISGTVNDTGLREFFAAEIAAGKASQTMWEDMLAGDDYVRGSIRQYLHGYTGNDVLANGDHIFGDAGNDVIFVQDSQDAYGGLGQDKFVFVSPVVDYVKYIKDFEHGKDKIALDIDGFSELGGKITNNNVNFGRNAHDAEGRLIVRNFSGDALLYYDPDGTGPERKHLIADITSSNRLTRSDFKVVDAQSFIPDVSGSPQHTGSATHALTDDHAGFGLPHAFELHAVIHLV